MNGLWSAWNQLSTTSQTVLGASSTLAMATLVLVATDPATAATQMITTSSATMTTAISGSTATLLFGLAWLTRTAHAQSSTTDDLIHRTHACGVGDTLHIMEDPEQDPSLDGATVYSKDPAQQLPTSPLNLCDYIQPGRPVDGIILRGSAGPFGILCTPELAGKAKHDGTAVGCTTTGKFSFFAARNLRSDTPHSTMQQLTDESRAWVCPSLAALPEITPVANTVSIYQQHNDTVSANPW